MSNVKLPQLEPYQGIIQPDDKLFVWEKDTAKLKQADVSQLPSSGTGGGTGGGTNIGTNPATFKIRITDPQCSIIGTDTVINDNRLLGFTDYPVRATQLNNAAFRDNELEYDSFNARVTLKNFILMASEFVVIEAPGYKNTADGGGSFSSLLARIEKLEMIAAPFMLTENGVNGGVMIWKKPANLIPAGWQEWGPGRGKTLIGNDPNDPDFDTIGKTGGEKKHTLTIDELPSHNHQYLGFTVNQSGGGDSGFGSLKYIPTGLTTATVGGSVPHNILNPYRVVEFIEFVGL